MFEKFSKTVKTYYMYCTCTYLKRAPSIFDDPATNIRSLQLFHNAFLDNKKGSKRANPTRYTCTCKCMYRYVNYACTLTDLHHHKSTTHQ